MLMSSVLTPVPHSSHLSSHACSSLTPLMKKLNQTHPKYCSLKAYSNEWIAIFGMIKSFTVISRVYCIFGMMKSLILLSLTLRGDILYNSSCISSLRGLHSCERSGVCMVTQYNKSDLTAEPTQICPTPCL